MASPWLTFNLFTRKDDDRPVYLTGNFNNWMPNDKQFQLKKLESGRYQLELQGQLMPTGQKLEYKYVKDGWTGEELNAAGMPTSNRSMLLAKGSVMDVVEQWKRPSGAFAPRFFPKIEIVSDKFSMPQLGKARRVSVLLPYNYYENTTKQYPVVYLQDGQNLFEDEAPYGSWHLDDQLGKMAERNMGDVIVVAVDHGGADRIKEFSPSQSNKTKEGAGEKYAAFLAETLKPHIDQTFRTLADAQHTAIGGSSMGGLISLFAGIRYPHLFSKFLIFSPSLWVSEKIYAESADAEWIKGSKLYFYVGGKEGDSTVKNVEKIIAAISDKRSDLALELDFQANGTHSESFWGEAFPKAAEWLFEDSLQGEMDMLEIGMKG